MKVLIATDDPPERARNDTTSALDGELVLYPTSGCADATCGCNGSWRGVSSGAVARAAIVVERPGIEVEQLRAAIVDALDRDGWVSLVREVAELADDNEWDDPDETIEAIIDEHVEVIEAICDRFGEGTVVCREGRHVQERARPSAA